MTYEPYLTVALKQGKGFHLIYTAGRRPGIISDLLAVNPDFAKAHPAAMVGAAVIVSGLPEVFLISTRSRSATIAVPALPIICAVSFCCWRRRPW